jgi:hypothetical protein
MVMAMEVKGRGAGQEREEGQLPRQRPDTPPVELAMHVIDPLKGTLHP